MKTSSLLTLLLLLAVSAGAQTYTYSTLVDLPSASSQGPMNPSGITIDDQGNLYATSNGGGMYCAPNGCGTARMVRARSTN